MLVGDPKQLPEIAAGGLFAALTERQPVIELKDNRRQQHEWEIEALRQLRDGNTTHALHAYLDHGRITIGYDAHHTKRSCSATGGRRSCAATTPIMLAGRRADVAELNMCGHVRAVDAGLPRRPDARRGRCADPGGRQGDDAAQRPQARRPQRQQGSGPRRRPRRAHDARADSPAATSTFPPGTSTPATSATPTR